MNTIGLSFKDITKRSSLLIWVFLTTSLLLLPPVKAFANQHAVDSTLQTIRESITKGDYGNIHGVILYQRGEQKAEWYFSGEDETRGTNQRTVNFTSTTLHDVRSVTKSIVSILFGIALQEGHINSIEDKLVSYFPDYAKLHTPDIGKIKLKHLLSMTSGLHWDEHTYPYTDVRNSETAMDMAEDRIAFILSQAIDSQPGERYNYSGGDVALIAYIIERKTGLPIDEYAKAKLFDPLNIEEFVWLKDSAGDSIAASGLRLTPRAMAKIGLTMMQDGTWGNVQIVNQEWIGESLSQHISKANDGECRRQYAYFWHLGEYCNVGFDAKFVAAFGNGGQRILIFPEQEILIIMTAGYYNQYSELLDDLTIDLLAAIVQ